MSGKLRTFMLTLLVALPADQLAKLAIERRVPYGARLPVLDSFFYLTHVRNPGAAFGLFTSASEEWRLLGFAVVSLVAALVIASLYRRLAPGDRATSCFLALIGAGAFSNFVDRAMRGEVVDFLHFRLWGGYDWPDFNLADTFIVVGVAALILELLSEEAVARAGRTQGEAVSDAERD